MIPTAKHSGVLVPRVTIIDPFISPGIPQNF
jgi:hypothetical protein